jgi:hypothetical protein
MVIAKLSWASTSNTEGRLIVVAVRKAPRSAISEIQLNTTHNLEQLKLKFICTHDFINKIKKL